MDLDRSFAAQHGVRSPAPPLSSILLTMSMTGEIIIIIIIRHCVDTANESLIQIFSYILSPGPGSDIFLDLGVPMSNFWVFFFRG